MTPFRFDAALSGDLADAAASAARAESYGFDGVVFPEVAHDPFLPAALAGASTAKVRVGTGVAVALARNPMSVAVVASDLHRLTGGRFVLGLGSQVRAHVVRRYSMPWSSPVERMREFIAAVRAIWSSWENRTQLAFEGELYQHTLMTPMFDHGPSPVGWPEIHLAAVGPAMTALAGETADGFLAHGFTTPAYLREVTVGQIGAGLARAGRSRSEIQLSVPVNALVVEDDRDELVTEARNRLAFYGSTPAYRPVLAHHGWAALGEELHELSRRGAWDEMGRLVDDEVFHTFTVVGDAPTVAKEIVARYAGVVDRIQLGAVSAEDTGLLAELVDLVGHIGVAP